MWPARGRASVASNEADTDLSSDLLTRLTVAAREAQRLRRRTRMAGSALLSVMLGLPLLVVFGLGSSYPTDFVAGAPRLPPTLGLVATSLDDADRIAAPLRAAGIPVESWSPTSFAQPNLLVRPAAWWISTRACC